MKFGGQNTAALWLTEVFEGNERYGEVGQFAGFFEAPPIKALNADKRSARPVRTARSVAG